MWGTTPRIAIDSHDGIHMSYYDYTNGDLKYATFSAPSSILDVPSG